MQFVVNSVFVGSISASTFISSAEKNKNKGGRGSKKQVFESYMTLEELSDGLKRGELIQVLLYNQHFFHTKHQHVWSRSETYLSSLLNKFKKSNYVLLNYLTTHGIEVNSLQIMSLGRVTIKVNFV